MGIKKEVTEGIKISVFDDDIGKDDALGMKVLDIAAIQVYQQLKSQWIPLESCKSGEVLISAEFTPQAIVDQGEKSIDAKSTEGQKKEKELDIALSSSTASAEVKPKRYW